MAVDSDINPADLDSLLDRHARDPGALLQILRETQERYGYISPAAITRLGAGLNIPRAAPSEASATSGMNSSANSATR